MMWFPSSRKTVAWFSLTYVHVFAGQVRTGTWHHVLSALTELWALPVKYWGSFMKPRSGFFMQLKGMMLIENTNWNDLCLSTRTLLERSVGSTEVIRWYGFCPSRNLIYGWEIWKWKGLFHLFVSSFNFSLRCRTGSATAWVEILRWRIVMDAPRYRLW